MEDKKEEYAIKLMYGLIKKFKGLHKPTRILIDTSLFNAYMKKERRNTFNGVYIEPINAPIIIAESDMPNDTIVKKIPVKYEDFGNYTKVTYTQI